MRPPVRAHHLLKNPSKSQLTPSLLDGETLEITFSGYSFSYAVITKNPKTMAGKLVVMPDSSEDEWWASISPQARAWTRKLAELMPRLLTEPDKALQVTNTHHKLTILLVGKHNTQVGIPLTT